MTFERLLELGFDRSDGDMTGLRVNCSQCAAAVIQGLPCHETGCPNIRHECKGCGNTVPKGVKYCEECT